MLNWVEKSFITSGPVHLAGPSVGLVLNLYLICICDTNELQIDADAIHDSAVWTDKTQENQKCFHKKERKKNKSQACLLALLILVTPYHWCRNTKNMYSGTLTKVKSEMSASSFAPVFQWCCWHPRDLQVSRRVDTVESSSLLHHSLFIILIVDRDDTLMSWEISTRDEQPTKLWKPRED